MRKTSTSPCTVWFPVRAGHIVLLSGFSTSATANGMCVQSVDAILLMLFLVPQPVTEILQSSDLSPESKRTVSAPQNDTSTSGMLILIQIITNYAQAMSQLTSLFSGPRIQGNMPAAVRIIQQMRMLEAQVKAQMQELQNLQQAGRIQEVEDLRKNIQIKTTNFAKLKILLRNISPNIPIPPTNQQTASVKAASAITTELPTVQMANESSSLQIDESKTTTDKQIAPEVQHSDILQSNVAIPTTEGRLTSGANAEALANQMQKLEQQHARSSLPQLSPPRPLSQTSLQTSPVNRHVWQGTLSWTAPDPSTQIEKEFSAEVIASQANGDNMCVFIQTVKLLRH